MSDNTKLIHDWQDKVKNSFGHEAKLYEYLFETLENFFYRYLETTENKALKVQELKPKTYGAQSFESNMMDALKNKNPLVKPGVMDLAKRIPKAQKPLVRYGLEAQVVELTADRGELLLTASVSWDFPDFTDKTQMAKKELKFKYHELNQFRKELALKLEEVCEIFI